MPNSILSPDLVSPDLAEDRRWDAFFAGGAGLEPQPGPWFRETVRGLTPGVALDLGCGNGRNARHLAELGWRVLAIDRSAVAIAQLHAQANERRWKLQAVVGDYARLKPAQPFANLIVMSYTPLVPGLRVIERGLLPGGHLILEGFQDDPPSAEMAIEAKSLVELVPRLSVMDCSNRETTPYRLGPNDSKAIQILAQIRSKP
jgi:SAM-dependent methyltransferase